MVYFFADKCVDSISKTFGEDDIVIGDRIFWDAAGAVFGTESVFNVSGETIRTVSIGFCTSRLSAGVSITLRFLSFLLFAADDETGNRKNRHNSNDMVDFIKVFLECYGALESYRSRRISDGFDDGGSNFHG